MFFLGDYVDRGNYSVEVISVLYSMKILFPNHVILLRGNHESKEITRFHGFMIECLRKLNRSAWLQFCRSFNFLPLAALINGNMLCVHGGIGPDLKTLNDIRMINRFRDIPDVGLLSDLLWSDPDDSVEDWAPSMRGTTYVWGLKPAIAFLESNNLTRLIRAHQVVKDGIDFPFYPDLRIVTVFSASHYTEDFDNKAVVAQVNENGIFSHSELVPRILKINKVSLGRQPSPRRKNSHHSSLRPISLY